MNNIGTNTNSGRLALCALIALGLAFAIAAPAASTTLTAMEKTIESDTPCVIISTNPPGVTVASQCAVGTFVILDGEPIP